MKNLEIENKYLLSYEKAIAFLKNLNNYETHKIVQIYIKIFKNNIKRIRKIDDRYILTIKKGSGRVRKEFENDISKKKFDKLSRKKIGNKIKKTRYVFYMENHKFELDIFKGKLKGLAYLEIEFNNEQEMKNFILPKELKDIVLKDVSSDINYTNSSLVLKRKKFKNLRKLFKKIESSNVDAKLNFKVDKKICIYDNLRIYLFCYLMKVKSYSSLLAINNDEELLHKFRINLRRIKSLMFLFKELFDFDIYKKINIRLKDAITMTNKKRDLDIFLLKLNSIKDSDEYIDFICYLHKEKEEEERKLIDFLNDRKVEDLIFDLEFLLKENSKFYTTALANLPAKSYIQDKIKYLWKDISKSIGKLSSQTPLEKFHSTRIKIKKIRYLTDAFENYSLKRHNKSLKNYQDIFGELNDLKNQITITNKYMPKSNNQKIINKLLNQLSKDMFLQKKKILSNFNK